MRRLRLDGQVQETSTGNKGKVLGFDLAVSPDEQAQMLGTNCELHILSPTSGCQECSNILEKGG